jgi:hypothetical protein
VSEFTRSPDPTAAADVSVWGCRRLQKIRTKLEALGFQVFVEQEDWSAHLWPWPCCSALLAPRRLFILHVCTRV